MEGQDLSAGIVAAGRDFLRTCGEDRKMRRLHKAAILGATALGLAAICHASPAIAGGWGHSSFSLSFGFPGYYYPYYAAPYYPPAYYAPPVYAAPYGQPYAYGQPYSYGQPNSYPPPPPPGQGYQSYPPQQGYQGQPYQGQPYQDQQGDQGQPYQGQPGDQAGPGYPLPPGGQPGDQAYNGPQQQTWYYCQNPSGYYPDVESCNTQWQQVPVTPSAPPVAPTQ
jgi:hypothetical protein